MKNLEIEIEQLVLNQLKSEHKNIFTPVDCVATITVNETMLAHYAAYNSAKSGIKLKAIAVPITAIVLVEDLE